MILKKITAIAVVLATSAWLQGAGPYVKNRPQAVISQGTSTVVTSELVSSPGWYWNKLYPNKFTILEQKDCFDSEITSITLGVFKFYVDVKITGKSECQEVLKIKGDICVCSKTKCVPYTDILEIDVTVKNN